MSFRRSAAVAAASALLAAACTGASGDRDRAPGGGDGAPLAGGGTLRLAGAGIDELDPARGYSTTSWFLARGVFRTLVAPGPAGPREPRPKLVADLAEDVGEPGDGGRTWTFTLREGVRFGAAVGGSAIAGVTGEQLVCDDLRYGLERLFKPEVGAAYAFYYEALEGVEDFRAGRTDGIAGIDCPNEHTIIFRLDRPLPDWPFRISLPAASPVPRRFAEEMDANPEESYGESAVATGPYEIISVGDTRVRLRRNEHWDPASDPVRSGLPERVVWRTDLTSSRAIDRVLEGETDLLVGAEPRGPNLARLVADQDVSRRLIHESSGCLRALYLDTTRPPFDDVSVRRAVARAVDRYVLKRMYGGPAVGALATSVVPPGIPGHLPPETFDPFPSPHGTGDVPAARRMLRRAGFSDWDREIVIAGAEGAPAEDVLVSVRADLERLGFTRIRTRLLPGDRVTRTYAADPPRAHIGTTTAWCKDFDDASTILRPLFHGDRDAAATSFNFPRLDDERLNETIDHASSLPTGPERTDAWEKANRRATRLAAWIPWSWDAVTILYSERLQRAHYLSFLTQVDWPNVSLED